MLGISLALGSQRRRAGGGPSYEVVTLSPTADTRIRSDNFNANLSTETVLSVGESNTGSARFRSLLRFDLSSLSGAVVQSAVLRIYANGAFSDNDRHQLVYRLKRAWVNTEVTWSSYSSGNSWGVSGGFGAEDCERSYIGALNIPASPTLNQYYEWQLDPGAIQEMVDGVVANEGFLLRTWAETNDNIRYASNEDADSNRRPQLVITYANGGSKPAPSLPFVVMDTIDINEREYRINALVSTEMAGTTYQALCYWDINRKMVIAVRALPSGAWQTYTYDGTGGRPDITPSTTNDDHRVCVIGLDRDGYMHVAYDHHNNALNYRVSSSPINAFDGSLGAATSMLGTNESSVSYPQFVNDPSGALYVVFRAGTANSGDVYFYAFDEVLGWSAAAGTAAGGRILNGTSTTTAPYIYPPTFDENFGDGGHMHFAWHWRSVSSDGDTNSDVGYVRWDGADWTQADGTSQTVPITQANQETANAIAEGTGLAGSGKIASDGNGNPHIVNVYNDGDGYVQIWHQWHDGTNWQTPQALTDNATLSSTGDPPDVDYGTPAIAIDHVSSDAIVLYTRFGKAGVWKITSSDYTNWSEEQIYDQHVGVWSVTFDPLLWRVAKKLALPVVEHDGIDLPKSISIIDVS